MRLSVLVALLLVGKAIAQTPDEDLATAVLANDATAIRTALDAGASPNIFVTIQVPDGSGGTIPTVVPALAAVETKAAIDELLAESDLNINVASAGQTSLFLHLVQGRRPLVQSILAATAPVPALDKAAATDVEVDPEDGSLSGGFNVYHWFSTMDEDGSIQVGESETQSVTAVSQAIAEGMMDDLIAEGGFDLDHLDANGVTPIFALMTDSQNTRSSAKRAVLVAKMAAAGADVDSIAVSGFGDRVALEFACSSVVQGPEFAAALFTSPSVDINDRLEALNNETCLIAAVRDISVNLNEDQIVALMTSLLDAGASTAGQAIGSLDTALHLAADAQSANAILLLTGAGARDNVVNAQGDLALHRLANYNDGNADACARLTAAAQALINEADSDLEALNNNGRTPAEVASSFLTNGGCRNLATLLAGGTVSAPKPSAAGKSAAAVVLAAATLALSAL